MSASYLGRPSAATRLSPRLAVQGSTRLRFHTVGYRLQSQTAGGGSAQQSPKEQARRRPDEPKVPRKFVVDIGHKQASREGTMGRGRKSDPSVLKSGACHLQVPCRPEILHQQGSSLSQHHACSLQETQACVWSMSFKLWMACWLACNTTHPTRQPVKTVIWSSLQLVTCHVGSPSSLRGSTDSGHMQILGVGTDCGLSSPSVLLFFDQQR